MAIVPIKLDALRAGGAAAQLSAQFQAAAGASIPRITLSNGRFILHNSLGARIVHNQMHLDVVIGAVDKSGSRVWWANKFTGADDATPPS